MMKAFRARSPIVLLGAIENTCNALRSSAIAMPPLRSS